MPVPSVEDRYKLFKQWKDAWKDLSVEDRYKIFKQIRGLQKETETAHLPEEIPFFKKQPFQPPTLGAEANILGFKPSYNVLPEPPDIFQDPMQPRKALFKTMPEDIREVAPETPEFRKPSGMPAFRITTEYENRIHTAKEARLLREAYHPGQRMAAGVEGFLPTPPGYKNVGFDEAFPWHRLGGRLSRIFLLSKVASTKAGTMGLEHAPTGISTQVAKEGLPWLYEKATVTPIVSHLMNHDIPATIASHVAYGDWLPGIIGNAVERGVVWSADAFIDKLAKTHDIGEATKAGGVALPFGAALGVVHVAPFQGASTPAPAGQIGLSKLFGEAALQQTPQAMSFANMAGNVAPVVLAGGIGGARAALQDYWEQGNQFKKSAIKEALLAAAWTGLIAAIGHKHLVDEWKRFNVEQFLWDKADAAAKADIPKSFMKPSWNPYSRTYETVMQEPVSREAQRLLYYNNFKMELSPAAHNKVVYEKILKETLPRQFHFLPADQLSKIQVELVHRVQGGENAIEAFGDITSQFFHAIKKVDMPVSEIEIPGMVLPTKYRTDFAELLREQIIQSEKTPLHPAKEGRKIQQDIINKLKAKFPEYNIEKAIDESLAKLPPKYHTAFAEALQKRFKYSEAVPLHPIEIVRDAERVAEEVFEIDQAVTKKFETMPWRQFTEGITPEEQKQLAAAQKKLEPLATPAKEKQPLFFQKPKGKTAFQEYEEKVEALKLGVPKPQKPVPKLPPEPSEHEKLRKHGFALRDRLKKMGYDDSFIHESILEGKSYAFDKPNSMTNDEIRMSIRRMLNVLDKDVKTRKLTRKENKEIARKSAIRAKIFNKLPEKPSQDLYAQIKEQFKDYEPETGHVFDWIRGVRHVFRKDKLLYFKGYKPLHDDVMLMDEFIVDNIRPSRQKASNLKVNVKSRKKVAWHRHLQWLKMANPTIYANVPLPVLSENEKVWDDYLTETYKKYAKIFKPRNLLPFHVYSPLIFDNTADDPDLEMLGTFYPEGVPKNIEAFFKRKREKKTLSEEDAEDSLVSLERYIRSGAKEYFLKEDVKRIREDLLTDEHIKDSMRKLLQSYTERTLGYPSVLDEFVGQTFAIAINFAGGHVGYKRKFTSADLNGMAHTLINLTYMSTMGLRPMPVLKNLTQSLNTACELGYSWTSTGIVEFLFKGFGEAEKAGVLMEYAPELYREYEEQNSFDTLRDVMLIGFQTADKINRSIAYYAARNKFNAFSKIFKNPAKLKKWLLNHHVDEVKRIEIMDAINKGDIDTARHLFAEEIVAKTQYLYNKYDSPLITRSSLGKMYYQFASWPENYIELIVDWGRNKNYAAALRAVAAALSLGYIAKQANKKWLQKFIWSMTPGAPLPFTEWKLKRYAVPPSMAPTENLVYLVGDLVALAKFQQEPEKVKKNAKKHVWDLLKDTMNWVPGGLLMNDIYKWTNISFMGTGDTPYRDFNRPRKSKPRHGKRFTPRR